MIHVIPLNDLKAHTQDLECACDPSVIWMNPDTGLPWEGDGPLVTHNSYDGRELFEC